MRSRQDQDNLDLECSPRYHSKLSSNFETFVKNCDKFHGIITVFAARPPAVIIFWYTHRVVQSKYRRLVQYLFINDDSFYEIYFAFCGMYRSLTKITVKLLYYFLVSPPSFTIMTTYKPTMINSIKLII